MSRRLHRLVAGLVPLLIWGATAQALEIAPTFQERTVVGVADVETDTAFRIEQAGDAAPDLNLFEALVEVEAELPVAFAEAWADQFSIIDSDGGIAVGEARAEITGDAEEASGFALGDSFFELEFVPDEDLRFRLEGILEVFGDPDADVVASVSLVDLDTGDELFGIGLDVDDGCDTDTCGPVPFDFVAELEAGGDYSLSAVATAVAPRDENDPVIPAGGSAAYQIVYTVLPIPEPSVAQLLGLGLLALAAQRRPQPPLRSRGASNSTT